MKKMTEVGSSVTILMDRIRSCGGISMMVGQKLNKGQMSWRSDRFVGGDARWVA